LNEAARVSLVRRSDVRHGSNCDIAECRHHVWFPSNTGHPADELARQLCQLSAAMRLLDGGADDQTDAVAQPAVAGAR
jgi:hypothetical protein